MTSEYITPEVVFISLILSAVIAFLSYFLGKGKGAYRAKEREEQKFRHKLMLLESHKEKLQEQIDALNQKSEKYLHFLVKIPEAVKNINSHLSIDNLLTSTIRLVKELIETDEVEIYMFDQKAGCLKLIAAYGTDRKESIEVRLKEGVVGSAAEIKMIFLKEQLKITGRKLDDEKIEIATPVVFRDELIAVIGIGKIKKQTENDKRFLAMIADLTAVAFKNCEYLDIAKDEAIKDALTGLYNRRYFFEKALEVIQRSRNYDFPFSIFIFDIDYFKHYNDTNGHTQGDILLKELSNLLKERSRSTDIVARYGGEEFIVLLQNTDKQNAMVYTEKIRKLIESHPFQSREKQPIGYVSISGGVATFPFDGETVEEIIKHADKALYKSKESGKNRVTEYQPLHFS